MMSQGSRLGTAVLSLVLLAAGRSTRAEPAAPAPEPAQLTVAGLEVGAVDLDRSAEFYSGVMGFQPVEGARPPDEVRLANGGVELTLRKTTRPASFDPEKGAHFYLNVEVSDLAATTRELEKRGLSLLGPPRDTAIGLFASLRDPAGNVHQLVERRPRSPQPFPPRVFNIGIRMASMAAAKGFYCRGLGFAVMSENHPPPIIPLKLRGTAPLILFEGAPIPAEEAADAARVVLVLDAPKLPSTLEAARRQGLTVKELGKGYAVLADPSGNRVKLRQVTRQAAASVP